MIFTDALDDILASDCPKVPFCPSGKEAIEGLLETKAVSYSLGLIEEFFPQFGCTFSCNLMKLSKKKFNKI